jgi:hypothetical protein
VTAEELYFCVARDCQDLRGSAGRWSARLSDDAWVRGCPTTTGL